MMHDDDDDDDGNDVISLSDVLIAVTDNSSQYNITERMSEAGFTPDKNREFFRHSQCLYTFLFYIFIFIHHKGSNKNNNNSKEEQYNLTKQRNRVTLGSSQPNTV